MTLSNYKPNNRSNKKLVVLIADDNATDRLILNTIVSQEGYQVLTAKDGIEAIKQYKQGQPDIILMDVIMPRLGGMDAARQIKADSGSSLVPILFLTSLHDPDSLAACLEAGGDDFLSKPYNPVILKAKISAALRVRDMHQQLHRHNQNMQTEQQIAKSIFDKVAHFGQLDRPGIRYVLSPKSVFNGDSLLVATRPDGGLNCFIGDFTGHGLSAAIGTMPLADVFYGMTARGYQLSDIIREMNDKLYRYLPVNFFCAGALVELDNIGRKVKIWLGGLPDIVLYHKTSGTREVLESTNLPLGILSGQQFNPDVYVRDMTQGDQLFLWSDGLHEAMNDQDEMFGDKRVMDVFENSKEPTCIFDAILTSLDNFVGNIERKDDFTLLSVTMYEPEHTGLMTQLRPQPNDMSDQGSQDWSMEYRMQASSIRNYNPVPFLHKSLMEVQGLNSIHSLVYTLIAELYSNAIDHGLLKLDSSMREDSDGFSQYFNEREQRLKTLSSGEIILKFQHNVTPHGGALTISCQDSGDGFDYKRVLSEVNKQHAFSGNGLPLLLRITDALIFEKNGRKAIAQINWSDNVSSQY